MLTPSEWIHKFHCTGYRRTQYHVNLKIFTYKFHTEILRISRQLFSVIVLLLYNIFQQPLLNYNSFYCSWFEIWYLIIFMICQLNCCMGQLCFIRTFSLLIWCFYDVFIVFYLLQRRRVNAIARDVCLSVCLSVCKQDYSKTRAWIWMTFCVSTGIGTWTNWSTFEPDPDHSPDAGTGLLAPISYALQRGMLLRRENPTYRY